MGKSTISMAIFHCYVSSPEGKSIPAASHRRLRPRWTGSHAPVFQRRGRAPGYPAAPLQRTHPGALVSPGVWRALNWGKQRNMCRKPIGNHMETGKLYRLYNSLLYACRRESNSMPSLSPFSQPNYPSFSLCSLTNNSHVSLGNMCSFRVSIFAGQIKIPAGSHHS